MPTLSLVCFTAVFENMRLGSPKALLFWHPDHAPHPRHQAGGWETPQPHISRRLPRVRSVPVGSENEKCGLHGSGLPRLSEI